MRAWLRGAVSVLGIAAATGFAAGAGRRDLNVLLVTVDTLRADRVGCYGYAGAKTPALDRLAAGGVRFADTYAQVPLTLPSHCSIMTGTYPIDHLVRNNGTYALGPDVPTLASLLKARGYATGAFVASFTLDSRFGLARGFDVYDDAVREEGAMKSFRSERPAGDVLRAFLPWFERNRGRKFFAWVHFYDPHLPYAPPPPFAAEFGNRRYDGEIAYADHVLGELVARLEAEKLLDRTLIVVAGDHGEALGEKREIDHGLFLYDGTLKVPLILRAAGPVPAGAVVSARVRLVDLMPTVLDLLGLRAPSGIRGTSLLPYALGKRKDDLPTYIETYYPRENYGWSELRGLIDGPWKYILAPTPEIYDLAADPKEDHNLAAAEPAVLMSLAGKLNGLLEAASKGRGSAARRLSPAEVERLRSLGYLGAGAGAGGPGGRLPDPKDRIEDYLLIFRGNLLENEGRMAEAAECYRRVLEANPGAPSNHVNLALLELRRNRPEEALRILEAARTAFPGSELVLSRLMGLYVRMERWEDVLSTGKDILGKDAGNFDALFLSGTASARLGRYAGAIEAFRRALSIEPENVLLRRRYTDALTAAGRKRETLAFLKAAAEKTPSPEAFHDYALALFETGDRKGAVLWMKRFLEAAPSDAADRAEALRLVSEWEKAAKAP